MYLVGDKVCVRDQKLGDSLRDMVWQDDSEIAELNPMTTASSVCIVEVFSIDALSALGGQHIGSCTLSYQTLDDVQLGIKIGEKNYWNKGYGTEAMNLLIDCLLTRVPTSHIWLKVLPWNVRAIRCYEKCGFMMTRRLALDGHDFIVMERRKT